METRFIVPGGTVANLDFVEGIFGNGGDPYLPENDASLAPETWTGHTGCVILAPHLTKVTKKELGLPHVSEATERQQRDGMCWETEDELYNGGRAFKVCARDARGVIVTIIADNYFGYCKKEVKTQISYSANLFGNAEEEHAGGALVFASYNLGQEYDETSSGDDYTLAEVLDRDPERFAPQPQGHADDREQPHIVLVPGGAHYSMRDMTVSWPRPDGGSGSDAAASGQGLPRARTATASRWRQQPHDPSTWTLVGTAPNATSCHKPAPSPVAASRRSPRRSPTRSSSARPSWPTSTATWTRSTAILDRDFSRRFLDPERNGTDLRPILSPRPLDRLGHQAAHPVALGVHRRVQRLARRASRPTSRSSSTSSSAPTARSGATTGAATSAWRRSTADRATRCTSTARKITLNMLRVGFDVDGSWRLFSLRHDFAPGGEGADRGRHHGIHRRARRSASGCDPARSYKLVENCENLLFQRPDDAIHRGYDKQAERDIATPGNFLSNFEPLTRADAVAMRDEAVSFTRVHARRWRH